jgi:hypothetical protein
VRLTAATKELLGGALDVDRHGASPPARGGPLGAVGHGLLEELRRNRGSCGRGNGRAGVPGEAEPARKGRAGYSLERVAGRFVDHGLVEEAREF